jgi:hypothetical protein
MEVIMDAAIELGAEDVVNVDEGETADEESALPSSKGDPAREIEVEVSLWLQICQLPL